MSTQKNIADVLRKKGNTECLNKADSLQNDSNSQIVLQLRSLSLNTSDIAEIANIIKEEKNNSNAILTSISFSYNEQIGNAGSVVLANSLPPSIRDIGLVDCGIGDQGGKAMLDWMQTAPNLRMICMEQNSFSKELKMEFQEFRKAHPGILVIV